MYMLYMTIYDDIFTICGIKLVLTNDDCGQYDSSEIVLANKPRMQENIEHKQ